MKREEDKTRINEKIKVPRVRLISSKGEQVGIISVDEALSKAKEEGLDLIEVSPSAEPPVCRLMDYGKFKYQQSKRQQEVKKHQKNIQVKEVKLRPKTEDHDFDFKLKNAIRFLEEGNKVKVSVAFRGREMAHRDLGRDLLARFQEGVGEQGVVEQFMKDEGRNLTMVFAPNKVR